MRFYDLVYGVFPYCSPSCRDKYLLPEYNKKLQEYLSNPLHINGTPAGVDFSSTPHATSTSVASTQAISSTSVVTGWLCVCMCVGV